MSHLEYCACGHPNDHAGKECGRCPCASGIRVDVATFQVLTELTRLMAEQSQKIARVLAVVEEATGLQSRLVDQGNGRAKVEVKPKIVMVGR